MSIPPPILAIATTTLSAAGNIAAGRAQARQAALQAAARQQAVARQRQIEVVRDRQLRKDQARLLARRRALLAARGIDSNLGSALLLQEQAAADAEFEALLARSEGANRVFGLEVEARKAEDRARTARTRATVRAGTTLLTAPRTPSNLF